MAQTKVLLVFTHKLKEEIAWPYKGYEYEKRGNELTQKLTDSCPGINFVPVHIHNAREAKDLTEKINEFDGILVYMLGIWTGRTGEEKIGTTLPRMASAPEIIARAGKPTVVVDDLFGGSGELYTVFPSVRNDGFPAIGLAYSRFRDVVDVVKLFKIIKQMGKTKILLITTRGAEAADQTPDISKYSAKLKEVFGTEVIRMNVEQLNDYYMNASEGKAEELADKWIDGAVRVMEPTRDEIVKSAKMHLALEKAMEARGADAVTVDCLGLKYGGKLLAFPCLSYFQMNNEGLTGVCQADLRSTVTQLLERYLTKEMTGKTRPSYVSNPVIDLSSNQIIYTHCVAPNKVFGTEGPENQYIIRSHAEDGEGASVQSLMPLGEKVTTAQIDIVGKIMAIHGGISVANIYEEKGCRTKLAVEANVKKIFENGSLNITGSKKGAWGWHRVTVYGDWRKQLMNLAILFGMNVFEEDK